MQGGDFNNYPNEITPYGSLWDPHHCLGAQNPSLSGYSDIITAFNSELGKVRIVLPIPTFNFPIVYHQFGLDSNAEVWSAIV